MHSKSKGREFRDQRIVPVFDLTEDGPAIPCGRLAVDAKAIQALQGGAGLNIMRDLTKAEPTLVGVNIVPAVLP